MNTTPENHFEVGESNTRAGLNVEYRVRPITRYIVTRHERVLGGELIPNRVTAVMGAKNTDMGAEYNNYETAYAVAHALASAEHVRLGYAIDDERIQYPRHAMNDGATQAPA